MSNAIETQSLSLICPLSDMAKLELVIGPSRTGKTTYAKNKIGFAFLSHDDMLHHAQWHLEIFKGMLVNTLNNHVDRDFILDGWFSTYNWNPKSVTDLQKKTGREVTVTCFYAPIDGVLERTKCETRADIIAWYRRMAHFYRDELRGFPFIFRDREREFSFSEYMRLVRPLMVTVSREEVMSFISWLERQENYDRYYQTINLPYDINLPAYERTELAWKAIADHVDFRGKTVLDVGCYHNFCGRHAEDAGARRVVAMDRVQRILDTAGYIGSMWGYETEFFNADLDSWMPRETFDIAMCMNMIQYVKHPETAARRLFGCSNMVIMEAHPRFKKICDAIPTHQLVRELPSPRVELDRMLYFYQRRVDPIIKKRRWKLWT
jgi:hypothetical protein